MPLVHASNSAVMEAEEADLIRARSALMETSRPIHTPPVRLDRGLHNLDSTASCSVEALSSILA